MGARQDVYARLYAHLMAADHRYLATERAALTIGSTGLFVIDSKQCRVDQGADGLVWHSHSRLDQR
jgi:hypothetical protein